MFMFAHAQPRTTAILEQINRCWFQCLKPEVLFISIKPYHVERKRRCGMTHTFVMFQADMTAVLTRRVRQRIDTTASCIFATSTRPSLCSVATATAVTSRPVARAQSTTRLSVCASSKSNTRRQTAQLSMT